MAENVNELLNVLYNMVQDAFTLPFGAAKCVLDREQVSELISEIRNNLPDELEQAKKIVANQNEILARAQSDSDAVRKAAEERYRKLIGQESVVAEAKKQAAELIAAAEVKAREVRNATNQYVDDSLKRTEEAIAEALKEVHESRGRFRGNTGNLPKTE